MHESSEEFEIRRDSTTDCRVSCPLVSEKKSPYNYNGKHGVTPFSRLFLIGSFSYLQVTMTYIRACTSSELGQIRSRTTELRDLDRLKKSMLPLFLGCFSSDPFFILTGNNDMHESLEDRADSRLQS